MDHRENRPHEANGQIRERSRSPTPALRVRNLIPYACPLCGFEISTRNALWDHLDAHHNGEWRDIYPPPAPPRERIEVDFTEYEGEVDDVESDVIGPVDEATTGEPEEGVEPMSEDEEKPLIPDLNQSPPPEE